MNCLVDPGLVDIDREVKFFAACSSSSSPIYRYLQTRCSGFSISSTQRSVSSTTRLIWASVDTVLWLAPAPSSMQRPIIDVPDIPSELLPRFHAPHASRHISACCRLLIVYAGTGGLREGDSKTSLCFHSLKGVKHRLVWFYIPATTYTPALPRTCFFANFIGEIDIDGCARFL